MRKPTRPSRLLTKEPTSDGCPEADPAQARDTTGGELVQHPFGFFPPFAGGRYSQFLNHGNPLLDYVGGMVTVVAVAVAIGAAAIAVTWGGAVAAGDYQKASEQMLKSRLLTLIRSLVP